MLDINASEFVDIIGTSADGIFSSELSASIDAEASGEGGSINIETAKLTIRDEAQVIVSSFGLGNAGNLTVQANDVQLEDRGQIIAETAFEEGGNIFLDIENRLILDNNSLISAKAEENANGGNINIDTNYIVTFSNQNNDIIASAAEGSGGNINITAEALFGIEERPQNSITNDIDASSGVGLDGTVSITTPDVNVLQNVIELPSSVVEPEQTVAQACEADRENVARNGLIIKGKGGVPPQPTEPLNSDVILAQQQNANPQAYYPDIKPIKTSIGDIMPARGIIKTESGEVILTAFPTDNIDRRTPTIKANCS